MPITPNNVLFHELVGLHVSMHRPACVSLAGLEGTIVDETANTVVVQRPDGRIARVLKKHNTFNITLPSGKDVLVPGDLIVGRPWDRLKNIGKKQYST
ncbi:MAG: ribonuclease P protein subunit [Candidatus Lokiarchaeota archaeon]|nr:ribonuclease P protein subunit [Candidatus Lokiarchaeota archaeon]